MSEDFDDLLDEDCQFGDPNEPEEPEPERNIEQERVEIAQAVAENPSMTALEIAFDLHMQEHDVRQIMYEKKTVKIIKSFKYEFADELKTAKEISINFLRRVVENKHDRYTTSDRINVAKFLSKNIVESSDADGVEEIHFVTEISKSGAVTKTVNKLTKQDLEKETIDV